MQSNPTELPPYVEFVVRPRETRDAQGTPVMVDEDLALITRPGQRDTVERDAKAWLADLDRRAQARQVPQAWATEFRKMFDAWKAGEAMPTSGTALRNWPAISPAVVENMIRVGIRTVEELAGMSDEAKSRVGMGAAHYQQLAQAWVTEKQGGSLAAEVTTLRRDNEDLQAKLKELAATVAALQQQAKAVL